MTRPAPIPVRQIDVKRAIRGALAAGLVVSKVEVDQTTGKIVILAGAETAEPSGAYEEWKAGQD